MRSPAPLSFFRTTVMMIMGAMLIMAATLPLTAQSPVPATAVQAAKMPQYASRLARPSPAVAHQAPRRTPGGGHGVIYDNGPINGTTDAWTLNFGNIVSDSFTVTSCNQSPCINGFSFGAWLFPGDVLQSVEISITSQPFGGTSFFDGVVNLTQSGCLSNQYGYNVCTETGNFNVSSLSDGTYWVTMQNASVNTGNPVYWDENGGPSQAETNEVGTIPSESFSVLGSTCYSQADEEPVTPAKAVTVPRSPTQTYRVIYNFTACADGGQPTGGLVIDAAGNLYGTTSSNGGPAFGGTVFKLSPHGSGWIFNRLYVFTGPNGLYPNNTTLVRGADGRLYGTTEAGGNGAGVIFGLSPAGNILPTLFSNWMETLLYDFTGGIDGANPGGSLALDSSGNIYGSAVTGGANGGGTLYEVTNSGIQVLHSFPAFQGDGVGPTGVVKGANGLYGITASGNDHDTERGTVYTTAGGYRVLLSFAGGEGHPDSLAADQADNLFYTFSSIQYVCKAPGRSGPGKAEIGYVEVDEQSASGGGSTLAGFAMPFSELMSWVSTDASGNVYGTVDNLGNYGNVYKLTCCWNYTDLHDFSGGPDDGATPSAAPVVDAQGNIYGTTQYGGTYGQGTVWEISP